MAETIYFVMEIIGTVAFSISGAVVGIRKKMDILGVITLGVTTAVGGGVIRDLILGATPPAAFRNPVYLLLASAVSVIVFIPAVRSSITRDPRSRIIDGLLLLMDSVGLGVFTVVGVKAGCNAANEFNFFLLVFVGVVTGVGGGVMRDLFAQEPPYIFHKHFYASASIIGAVVCVSLWNFAGEFAAMLIGLVCVTALRLAAAKFRWSLPKA